jgi:hypothetical protein
MTPSVLRVANVIAGQAKTLFAGTPQAFSFSVLRVGTGPLWDGPQDSGSEAHVLALGSTRGDFTLPLLRAYEKRSQANSFAVQATLEG